MKKLQVVLTGLIVLVGIQFTMVSCEDTGEIIKSQDDKIELQKSEKDEEPDRDDDN